MINKKSSRKNNELNSFVIVLNSLQSSWKIFLYMLIEVEKSLKRKCEKIQKSRHRADDQLSFFFKKFKNKVRKNNQMRIYSRQFKNISIKLIKWKQLNIYTQCSWYLQRFSNFYRIKLIRKHNFDFSNSNILIFELFYKTVIVIIDINHVLQKLNVLNSKKSKNNIDKLIDLVKTDQKTNKSFNSKTIFASSVLSAILIQITFEKIIKSFIEAFKIMHFNNARTIIIDEI